MVANLCFQSTITATFILHFKLFTQTRLGFLGNSLVVFQEAILYLFFFLYLGYWDDTFKQREFMDWAGAQIGIQTHEDWYQVSIKQILDLPGGHAVMKKYANSLIYALQRVYPEYNWQPWKSKAGVPSGLLSFLTLFTLIRILGQ